MLDIQPVHLVALIHNHDLGCGPKMCAYFGCGSILTRYEGLCGDLCVLHQKKHEKDPADLLNDDKWEFGVIIPLQKVNKVVKKTKKPY